MTLADWIEIIVGGWVAVSIVAALLWALCRVSDDERWH